MNAILRSVETPDDPDDNGSGTDSWGSYSTNDLWLEITAFTNNTAALVIHRPESDTSLSHDLYYTTNLAAPIQWSFAMRCVYTNVLVPNLCSPQGFFRLGPDTNGDLTVSISAVFSSRRR